MSDMSASYIARKKYNITYMQDYDVKTIKNIEEYIILHLCIARLLGEQLASYNGADIHKCNM